MLSGEILLMEKFSTCLFIIKKELCYCICPTHWWASPGDEPSIWVTKGTGCRELSQVPNPLVFSFSIIHYIYIYIFILLPLVHLSLVPLYCIVSDTVQTHFRGKALCISNSWATELTSSLTDSQGDANVDMLECMSPLPPSALCRHILNNHRQLWQERMCVHYMLETVVKDGIYPCHPLLLFLTCSVHLERDLIAWSRCR